MKAMNFFSDVRTRHIYGWVSIIWFTSAISIAVSESVELQAASEVTARCGENVTLTCDTSPHQLDIKLFVWLGRNKTCHYGHHQADPEILCDSAETNYHRLTMTLLNVMPFDQGKYLCKLRTTHGVKSVTTVVTVQDCLEHSNSSINGSHANCWFSGVYPSGSIHWLQNEVNLTDSASPGEEEDQHGRYKVCSTIDVQKGNSSQPFTCSLWIPSVGKYLTNRKLHIAKAQKSSGDMVKLPWIFVMVGIMMVTFVR